jgi:hypothetical protein
VAESSHKSIIKKPTKLRSAMDTRSHFSKEMANFPEAHEKCTSLITREIQIKSTENTSHSVG